jgi:hypothetical protein
MVEEVGPRADLRRPLGTFYSRTEHTPWETGSTCRLGIAQRMQRNMSICELWVEFLASSRHGLHRATRHRPESHNHMDTAFRDQGRRIKFSRLAVL